MINTVIKILVCLITIVIEILLIAKLKAELVSIDVTLMTRVSIVVHEFRFVSVAARPRPLLSSAGLKPTSLNSTEIKFYNMVNRRFILLT